MLRWVSIVVGVLTIVCACLGLAYSVGSAVGVLSVDLDELPVDAPHFLPAYYVMSAVCIACYVLLAWGGYQLSRGSPAGDLLLIAVWLFEIVYFIGIALSWMLPNVGMSIGAATGVAVGGLMAQFIILLPVWGPVAVFIVHRRRQVQPRVA